LLGPWNQIVEISTFIADRFRDYVAHNKDITLSAGITVHKSGEPVHSIADQAEKELERSKHRKLDDFEVKNAVTMFGITVDWAQFSSLIEKGSRIEELILQDKITKALAGRMLGYVKSCNRFMNGDIKSGMYQSHMKYDFQRNLFERLPDDQESRRIAALLSDPSEFNYMKLPISWALYRIRSD
jgi:CRISPR-associated protein Csm1